MAAPSSIARCAPTMRDARRRTSAVRPPRCAGCARRVGRTAPSPKGAKPPPYTSNTSVGSSRRYGSIAVAVGLRGPPLAAAPPEFDCDGANGFAAPIVVASLPCLESHSALSQKKALEPSLGGAARSAPRSALDRAAADALDRGSGSAGSSHSFASKSISWTRPTCGNSSRAPWGSGTPGSGSRVDGASATSREPTPGWGSEQGAVVHGYEDCALARLLLALGGPPHLFLRARAHPTRERHQRRTPPPHAAVPSRSGPRRLRRRDQRRPAARPPSLTHPARDGEGAARVGRHASVGATSGSAGRAHRSAAELGAR